MDYYAPMYSMNTLHREKAAFGIIFWLILTQTRPFSPDVGPLRALNTIEITFVERTLYVCTKLILNCYEGVYIL